jgi:hypothetical protein
MGPLAVLVPRRGGGIAVIANVTPLSSSDWEGQEAGSTAEVDDSVIGTEVETVDNGVELWRPDIPADASRSSRPSHR